MVTRRDVNDQRRHLDDATVPGTVQRFWRRAFVRASDPPLHRPRTPRIEPIRRSWIGAFWHVRIGLQAGTSLEDFLRSRFARYLGALPVPRARLPLTVEIEDGQLAIRPVPPPPAQPPPQDGTDAWLAPLVAAEGPLARREVVELELRMQALDGEIEAARRRAEECARKLAADISVGLMPGPPDVDATAEQLGRPRIRSGAPRAAALAFAGAALAAEAWQVALPLLAANGIDTANLGAELGRRPAELAFATIFALAIATGLFAFAHAGLDAAAMLFRGDADVRRRRWLASAALASGGAASLVAGAVAGFRGPSAGPGLPDPAPVLLLLAVPVAAALVVRAARRDDEARAAEIDAALAWDRERARALGERARRLEELAWAEDEARALEARREAARLRLRQVNARAVQAARLAADAERREREDLARLVQSLIAALELDRYEFLRQASARGAHELLSLHRRSPNGAGAEAAREAGLDVHPGHLAS
jgi:hypothetical protein